MNRCSSKVHTVVKASWCGLSSELVDSTNSSETLPEHEVRIEASKKRKAKKKGTKKI